MLRQTYNTVLAMEKVGQQNRLTRLKNYITNSVFHLGGITKLFGSSTRPTITLFGKEYPRQEGQEVFKKIIWLTYRADNTSQNSKVVSDVGWGCMIRAGQMMMAQALRNHSGADSPEELLSIVSAFLDDDEDKNSCFNYSIQKVVKRCEKEFGLQPGSWLSVGHISFTLKDLHSMRPLRGYDTMKLYVNSSSALFYEDILQKMGLSLCTCLKTPNISKIICKKCHKQTTSSLMILVITRLGVEKPSSEYQQMFGQTLNMKQCIGVIGGKPGKALYIVGRDSDQYIYLDPHYVQPSSNRKNIQSLMQTYFCQSYRTVKYQSLDPSVGFGFYVSDLVDLQDFVKNLQDLKNKYPKSFFIYTDISCPQYLKEETSFCQSTIENNRKSEDLEFTNSFQYCVGSLE